MSHAILSHPLPDQPCVKCQSWAGTAYGVREYAWCMRTGKRRVQAQADQGCAFFWPVSGWEDDWMPAELVGRPAPRKGDAGDPCRQEEPPATPLCPSSAAAPRAVVEVSRVT